MLAALRAKFLQHAGPAAMLLATGDAGLVEGSPHDLFWGAGFYGGGQNQLGRLLMQVRGELQEQQRRQQQQQQQEGQSSHAAQQQQQLQQEQQQPGGERGQLLSPAA